MVQMQTVKNRGYLFTFDNFAEYGLNIYLIKGEKFNYIIDTGLGSKSMEPVLNYIGDDDKKVVVINTHYHWDHIWGNHACRDAVIVSHRLCHKMILAQWDGMLKHNGKYADGTVEKCLPTLVFDSQLYFPEDKIKLFYTPGHTIDGISIWDEREKVLIAGDNVGDTPEELVPELSCAKEVYRHVVSRYMALDFDLCLSGHNRILTRDEVGRIPGLIGN